MVSTNATTASSVQQPGAENPADARSELGPKTVALRSRTQRGLRALQGVLVLLPERVYVLA